MLKLRIQRRIIICFLIILSVLISLPDSDAWADSASTNINRAKENVQISISTQNRIASELEYLKQSDKTSPEIIALYKKYLQRVQAMVAENQKILEQMEAAQFQLLAPPHQMESGPKATADVQSQGKLPSPQAYDDVVQLDKELGQSLAEFDEMLLKEQTELTERLEQIREQSASRLNDLALEAASAANEIREKGGAVNTSSAQKDKRSKKAGSQAQEPTTEESEEPLEASKDQQRAAGDKGQPQKDTAEGGATARSKKAAYDDDIVARQLREAAEKETDPELKEKLWQEYEAYKKGKS